MVALILESPVYFSGRVKYIKQHIRINTIIEHRHISGFIFWVSENYIGFSLHLWTNFIWAFK
jgi:hypothetical protein